MFGLTIAREGLDDNHAATAAWAWVWQSAGLIGFGGGIDIRLRCALRHGGQLASASDIGGAVFAVGEQPVVADAMQALGQHMDQESPDELMRRQRLGLVPAGPLDPVILAIRHCQTTGEADFSRSLSE